MIGAGQMGTDVVAQMPHDAGHRRRGRRRHRPGAGARRLSRSAWWRARWWRQTRRREADAAVAPGKRVVTTDYHVVTDMAAIDVMLEATGVPEIGSRAALRSARQRPAPGHDERRDRHHGRSASALVCRGTRACSTALAAGDEPAACKELYDFAAALGLTIVAAGKGKNNPLDRHAVADRPCLGQRSGAARPQPEHADRVCRRQQDDGRNGRRLQRHRPGSRRTRHARPAHQSR